MSSKVTVNIFSNPFNLSQKDVDFVDAGTAFIDYLKVKYPNGFKRPTRVLLNGHVLKVDDYDIVLCEKDVVEIQILPCGGITKDPALTIALLFGALAGLVLPSVLNSQPEIPSLEPPAEISAIKIKPKGNAYDLRSQSNVARLNEPIPTQYGKFKWFPDLAAEPWFENSQNERYLNQLFCLGWGQFTINSLRLGDIALDTFDGLSYEVYEPNTEVNLFHDNMYTVPTLKRFNIYHSFRYRRLGTDIYFSKTAGKITAGSGYSFNDYIDIGDTILISCPTTPAFSGGFVVTGVSESEIELADVSIWPGDNTNPGTVTIYNLKHVRVIFPNGKYEGYPDDVPRPILLNYTPGQVTSPVGTEAEVFYVDIDFPNGIYQILSDDYVKLTVSFLAILYPINDNNEYIHTLRTETGASMSGSGTTWRPDDVRWWDNAADFTFYDNGIEIDNADISSLVYGVNGNGAHVVFTGSKTGPITFDGVSKLAVRPFEKTVTFSAGSSLPQRTTLEFNMAEIGASWEGPGRFMFYLGRNNGHAWNTQLIMSDGVITGLKSKLTSVKKYGPYTMLAVRIKATSDTDSNNSKKINVIATRKLLQWNGSAWTGPTATRSIAWALADIWMSTYGASRSALDLDVSTLLTLDALWSSRGDTFDGVFDSNITVWEALQKIARAGRCRPIFDGSTLTFVRDGAQSTYTAVFGPNNILPNSFSMDYSFSDNQSPSVIKIKYLDEDRNYSPAEVLSSNNGGKVREVDFFGVVNYEQAWRESQYLEAQMLRQRLNIKFSTEMAGHIPFYGDLISVQYDLPSWGQGGQVVDKTGTTITTSQPLDWSGSSPFYMSFMRPNGSLSGPHTVTQGVGDYEAILDTDVTDFTFIFTANNQNPTIYQFGPSTNWNKACVVTKVTPKGDNETIDIQCVPYDAAIHTADEGTPPTKPSTTPTGNPIPPSIGGLVLTNTPGSGSVVATWNPLSNINNYKVQKSTDNSTWTDVSLPSVAMETISATGVLYVRVASVIDSIVGPYTKAVIVAS